MRDSGQIEQELKRVREERKKIQTNDKVGLFLLVVVVIFILFILFGCKQNKEDYRFEVTKVVIVNNCQVVTFANKFDHYTLWCPLEPKYEVGQILEIKEVK